MMLSLADCTPLPALTSEVEGMMNLDTRVRVVRGRGLESRMRGGKKGGRGRAYLDNTRFNEMEEKEEGKRREKKGQGLADTVYSSSWSSTS